VCWQGKSNQGSDNPGISCESWLHGRAPLHCVRFHTSGNIVWPRSGVALQPYRSCCTGERLGAHTAGLRFRERTCCLSNRRMSCARPPAFRFASFCRLPDSGCTSGPHTHVQRKVNGVLVNFTMPCNNSHFDDPSTYYDDSDGTWP
jgi:hypothetical protein